MQGAEGAKGQILALPPGHQRRMDTGGSGARAQPLRMSQVGGDQTLQTPLWFLGLEEERRIFFF